jgi:hypothetical protein
MSKQDRFKRRNRERRDKPPVEASPRPEPCYISTIETIDNRPTPERMARGIWITPERNPDENITIDRAVDMIGLLFATGQIDYAQHAAARQFQEILESWLAELSLVGFRSCLAGGVGGYDNSDGDPAAARAHDAMMRRLGSVRYWYLRSEIDKGPDGRMPDLAILRRALDAYNGC